MFQDSTIVFFDRKNTGQFKLFSLKDQAFLFSYPSDLTPGAQNRFIDFNSMSGEGNTINYLDYPYYKKSSIDFENKTLSEISSVDLSKINQDINRVTRLDDTLVMAMNFTPESDKFEHLIFSTKNSSLLKKFGERPDNNMIFKSDQDESLFFIYSSISNKSLRRIAVFYRNINMIRLYSYDGNLIKTIRVGQFKWPQKVENQQIHFIEPFALPDNFFVMHVNKNNGYAVNDPSKIRSQIHKYDWDGNLVKSYYVDAPIYTFAVSEDNKTIIAATYLEDTPIIQIEM